SLPRRYMDDQAVQFLPDPDLAAEPTRRPDVEGEVEHVLFHHGRATDSIGPRSVDMHVAGGTSAGAPALGHDAGDAVHDGALHDAGARLGFDLIGRAIRFRNVGDFGHDVRLAYNCGSDA